MLGGHVPGTCGVVWVDGRSERRRATGSRSPVRRRVRRTTTRQINGCSVCVDIHTRELEYAGESSERMYTVAAWRSAAAGGRRQLRSPALWCRQPS
ncbi:MAG TPA: carboxymuconolactone decarboxylase family protein [Solirubrobacteraceae bacterium]